MAQIYHFTTKLIGLEKSLWRDLEISDNCTVAQLGYTNLASYEGKACHLFNIKYRDDYYELPSLEEDNLAGFRGIKSIDPRTVKLTDLNLKIGDVLLMEYDYGAGWEWSMQLMDISEMKRGTGKHYPYVSAGAGRGIIEDTSIGELESIIRETDCTGAPAEIDDIELGGKIRWDYRTCFPMEYDSLFKGLARRIQEAYEEPFEE